MIKKNGILSIYILDENYFVIHKRFQQVENFKHSAHFKYIKFDLFEILNFFIFKRNYNNKFFYNYFTGNVHSTNFGPIPAGT